MDIPANSSICNECDNRICINFVDIIMWILRREMLYTQGRRLWTFALKTDLLVRCYCFLDMSVRAAFTVENIYDNKRNDIYYWENLNSSNYDKQDFEKEIEWNFDVKD